MSDVRASAELVHTTPEAEQPDLVIVGEDGHTVTVEVKVGGTAKLSYSVPKKHLGVVFTAKGVEPSDDEADVVGSAQLDRTADPADPKLGAKTRRNRYLVQGVIRRARSDRKF